MSPPSVVPMYFFFCLPGLYQRPIPHLLIVTVGCYRHCLVFFFRQDPSKGKESFARAKEASGLTAGLTGALGKRTKYQQSQIAQLVLVASSATPVCEDAGHESSAVAPPPPPASPVPAGETASAETPSGGDGGGGAEVATADGAGAVGAGPELGMSTAVGEEGRRAAARQTVHAEDSALLEDISFVERDLENPGKLQVCFFVCFGCSACMCGVYVF